MKKRDLAEVWVAISKATGLQVEMDFRGFPTVLRGRHGVALNIRMEKRRRPNGKPYKDLWEIRATVNWPAKGASAGSVALVVGTAIEAAAQMALTAEYCADGCVWSESEVEAAVAVLALRRA